MSGGQTIRTGDTPLSSLSIQSSVAGACVPILYGRNRIPGNLLDYDDFKAIPHTTSQSSGGKGGSVTTENTTYTYQASFIIGLCEGPDTSINAFWKDKTFTANANIFNKFLGTYSQTAWSTWNSQHPTKALAYRGVAYVAAAAYNLDGNASLGNHSFDVTGRLPFNAGTIDGANPKDVVTDYLTNAYYGAGFPSANLGDLTQFSSWCVANNVFLSPLYDTQQEARQAISDLMQVTNSGIFFSEGLLKIAPFSDTAATANGVTYSPNVTPAYDLGDDDFLDLDQPVRVMRTPNADAYNQVQIEFLDSANQYNAAIATAQDQASIELYGLKPLAKIDAHEITDATTARLVAQLILQRVLYTRNVYEFRLGWKYGRLEPCDYVRLTDARLGLSLCPVRVLSVEEDETGELSIQAEDAPPGVMHSPLYTQQPGSGYTVNYGVAPGNVAAPAFFEVPPLQSVSGLAVGVAVAGNSADWGGCEVWASNDGTSYEYVGQVIGGARYGTLSNSITAAADQVARVALAGNGGQIFTGSTADANAFATLSIIEDEFVCYTTSALVSANTYDLTLHLRGIYSTTAASHASTKQFIRVDDAIAYSDALDLSYVGKTIYFKFLSFNRWNSAKQLLADVTAYSYVIRGVMAKLPPPGLSGLSAVATQNGIIVAWTDPGGNPNGHTEIARSDDNNIAHASVVGSETGPVGLFPDPLGAAGLTKYYWVRQVNGQGFPTAWLGPVSATTGQVTGAIPATGSVVHTMVAADAIWGINVLAGTLTGNHMAVNSFVAGDGKIATAAIGSLQLAGHAATIPVGAYTAAAAAINSYDIFGSSSFTTIQSAGIDATDPANSAGIPVIVDFSLQASSSDSAYPSQHLLQVRVVRDSTVIYGPVSVPLVMDTNQSTGAGFFSSSLTDSPGTGTHTYLLQAQVQMPGVAGTRSASASLRNLELIGAKR